MDTIGRLAIAIGSACIVAAHTAALAQSDMGYPGRAVKVIVPFPPGGATDIMARHIAQQLTDTWRQPVIVENRPGGNGLIGADAVAKSAPDGYTVLVATIAHSANVSLFPQAPYQFEKDLRPIAILGLIPLVPVVQASSPVRSLQDLVASSKSQNLNAGSSGNGTSAHLGLALFKGVTGAKLQHVPYKGGAPAMTDLLGGQIDVIFALLPECLPHLKSGRLRALAVTSATRHPLLPDVPTAFEAGIPGIEVTSWNGLMVPASTPRTIVAKINADVVRSIGTPEVRRRIIELGYEPTVMSVDDAERFVIADVARWAKVTREANIKAD